MSPRHLLRVPNDFLQNECPSPQKNWRAARAVTFMILFTGNFQKSNEDQIKSQCTLHGSLLPIRISITLADPTAFRRHTDGIPTAYRRHTDGIPTAYRRHTDGATKHTDGIPTAIRRQSDGIPTAFRRHSDGMPTAYRRPKCLRPALWKHAPGARKCSQNDETPYKTCRF